MWRRPFYIGIQTNAFLVGKPIKGNWEPLISEEVFWRVQNILDGNKHGYIVEKNNDIRPLVGTLFYPVCGKKLTGYEVKNGDSGENGHPFPVQSVQSSRLKVDTQSRVKVNT